MKKLFLGAAFYPEVYGRDLPTLDEDIEWMKRGGFNVMRIGEFSWSAMEPHDGEFDLVWLRRLVDRLYGNGIYTIMCTPSATPPGWLTKKYPETLKMEDDGNRKQHGARRHCCSNSRIYRKYCARINRELAREFAGHPAVIGWQLDNEISATQRCRCPECMAKFRERLERKFGTVGNFNRKWFLGLWSQEYESFEDVPYPGEKTWSHPSLMEEYYQFLTDSDAEFLNEQAATLRDNGVGVPIGTDLMTVQCQHFPTTVKELDIVQFNHYHSRQNLWASALWYGYMQGLKPDVPFWVTETSTSANGSASSPDNEYPLGFNRVNSLMPFAFGAVMNNYWLWRAHPAGHELMHGSVLTTQGRPVYNFGECAEVGKTLAAAEDFLAGTRPDFGEFAMNISSKSSAMFLTQPTVSKFNYWSAVSQIWRGLAGTGMLPRVLESSAPLDGVRVLYSPYLMTLEDGGLMDRLPGWIEGGGIWVAGPMTDIRDANGAKYPDSPFGLIEKLTGARCEYGITAHSIPALVEWPCGEYDTAVWTDAFTLAPGQERIATYKSGEEPSPFDSMAAAAFCPVGRGGVILLGTQPPAEVLARVLAYAFKKAGIAPGIRSSGNVFVVPRSGKSNGVSVCEVERREGEVYLDGVYADVVTGEEFSGTLRVAPYTVTFLEKRD